MLSHAGTRAPVLAVTSTAAGAAAAVETLGDGTTAATVVLWCVVLAGSIAFGYLGDRWRGLLRLSAGVVLALLAAEVVVRLVDADSVRESPASPIVVALALPVLWLAYAVGATIRRRPAARTLKRRGVES